MTSTYQGRVRTGRGAARHVMAAPGFLEACYRLTGLQVIPGTLNLTLGERFDPDLLSYVTLADLGWRVELSEYGIRFSGEPGMHYARVTVAGRFPACLMFPTWVDNPFIDAELISAYHLRTELRLEDGDLLEFRLWKPPVGAGGV